MEYRVVKGYTVSELEKNVQKLIEIGFVPTGGVSTDKLDPGWINHVFRQAMFKK